MGEYIGATHVEAYNPVRAPFSAQSRPNLTQVNELILQAEAKVAAALDGGGYTTPVASTATAAFKLVQGACAQCAAHLVESVAPQADPKRIEHYRKMCDSALAMIEAGNLPDVDKAGGGAGEARTGYSTATPPYFTRDMEL